MVQSISGKLTTDDKLVNTHDDNTSKTTERKALRTEELALLEQA